MQLEVVTSLYSLLLAEFKMRFISFIIAGAFFNILVYAYAKPVRLDDSGIGHLVPWCDGYNDDTFTAIANRRDLNIAIARLCMFRCLLINSP